MIISYISFSYSLLYVRQKTFFKRNLLKKQSQNTKQVEYCKLFETKSFSGERLKVFQKQGDKSLTGRRGELNQNGKISPSDGERWQVCCKIDRSDVSRPSQKLFTVIKKECVISQLFFLWFNQFILD